MAKINVAEETPSQAGEAGLIRPQLSKLGSRKQSGTRPNFEMELLHTALLLLPIAIVPVALIVLLWLGIPFSTDPGNMLTSPLFLLISALTIIGFFINFGIVLPQAKENQGALASVLVWPANFIVSGISLAYFSWNMLAFHLFVLPMLLAAAYNYYYFFRHQNKNQ